MPKKSEFELSTMTIDDLVCELSKRFDSFVVYGVVSKTKLRERPYLHFGGSWWSCVGLARDLEHVIQRQLDKAMSEGDDIDPSSD